MKFIAQALTIKHEFWRYLVGSIIVAGAAIIGQLPFTAAVAIKAESDGESIMNLTETEMLTILEPNVNLFLILLSFVIGTVALYFVVKFLHDQKFKDILTARPKLDWGRIMFAFFLWGILSTGLTLVDYYLNPEDYAVNFNFQKFAILAVIAVIMIPIQTSLEEFIFRGYLIQGFGTLAKNRWFPLVMTSVIFGMLHIANPEVAKLGYSIMSFYIGTGLMLGIMTLMDDGMELALGFHAANNLFTALLVTSDWTAFQTHSILKDIAEPEISAIDMVIPLLVLFPLILLVFAKKYNWTNWSERLFGEVKPIEIENKLSNIGKYD